MTYPKNKSTFKMAVQSSMPLKIYPQPSERSAYVSWIKWLPNRILCSRLILIMQTQSNHNKKCAEDGLSSTLLKGLLQESQVTSSYSWQQQSSTMSTTAESVGKQRSSILYWKVWNCISGCRWQGISNGFNKWRCEYVKENDIIWSIFCTSSAL